MTKRRCIFSIYTKINDNTKKRTDNSAQFEKHYDRLHDGLSTYAKNVDSVFLMFSPDRTDYDNLNLYKIQQWEKLLDDYDEVLYLDFDIIPNTKRNIFEIFDFNNIITFLLPCDDWTMHMGFKAKGETSTEFYERTKLESYEDQKKMLDKYHWLIKVKENINS